MELMIYAGGWDCNESDVRKWITNGVDPDVIYASLEEASEHVYYDANLCPDDTVWVLFPDGHIEQLEDW